LEAVKIPQEGATNNPTQDPVQGGGSPLELPSEFELKPFNETPPSGSLEEWADGLLPKLNLQIALCRDRVAGHDEEYPLFTKEPRGAALIINNEFRGHDNQRDGSEIDVWHMGMALTQLGYPVYEVRNVPSKHLPGVLERFKGYLKPEMDSLVVVTMSHGEHGNLQMGDLKKVSIYEDIVYQFTHDKCEVMKGKPKMFLFQACQVLPDKKDSTYFTNLQIDDVLVAVPCLPGQYAYRHERQGSRYIYAVTKALVEKASTTDAYQLFNVEAPKILRDLQNAGKFQNSDAQIACVSLNLLKKKFYFNPEKLSQHKP